MLTAIKFAGVFIAALWLGGSIFFTFFVAPAFFRDPLVVELLKPPYNGEIAQLLLKWFYKFQYLCGTFAIIHLGFDWIYTGKTMQRFTLWLVLGSFAIALFGGLWMHPKLHQLHRLKHSEQYGLKNISAEVQEMAPASFRTWHSISQGAHLLMLCALCAYLWQMMHPKEGPKYLGSGKFNIDKHY
ncbi:MAG: DUF4149 domain-containing protein [Verrucomicrobiia bacterium]